MLIHSLSQTLLGDGRVAARLGGRGGRGDTRRDAGSAGSAPSKQFGLRAGATPSAGRGEALNTTCLFVFVGEAYICF